jgi:hypothetical protein
LRLYKFLSSKWAKEAIVSKELKISIPANLNDPWDGHALQFQDPREKQVWLKLYNEFSQNFGIVCFSKSCTDPVLWSHYSDQHRGIALGFDVDDSHCSFVQYQDELIEFGHYLNLKRGDLEKYKFIVKVLTTKYTNWRYEEEVRIFVKLPELIKDNVHFFTSFDDKLILKEVIFGARHSETEEMSAVLSHTSKDQTLALWKAALGNQTFAMCKDENWEYGSKQNYES